MDPKFNPSTVFENVYVIRRASDGKYLAVQGMKHSYTRNVADARLFNDYAAAVEDCCSNERPVQLAALFAAYGVRS